MGGSIPLRDLTYTRGFMFYTIYKTTNLINGKIYIGKHKTQNLDDNYLGSGKAFRRAVNKYGVDNFTKEYLFIFDNEEDMNNKELELVSEEFIKEDTNYNLRIGGDGGWEYANTKYPKSAFYGKTHKAKAKKILSAIMIEKYKTDAEYYHKQKQHMKNISEISRKNNPNGTFYGKSHTDEAKRKIGKSNSIKQKGSNNSQYGTMWIHSLEEKISKRIKKDEKIPDGWHKGRKMKFS